MVRLGVGSGFRVQGSGFRVQGSGFRVQWFRVQGSGFRVQGSGFRVEWWSGGVVEGWRVGVEEWRSGGVVEGWSAIGKHLSLRPACELLEFHVMHPKLLLGFCECHRASGSIAYNGWERPSL